MKAKAKPVKGSARTRKFDSGGAVAALAGLGTLAYLMSKNKKKSMGYNPPEGEYKPQGKFPEEQSHEKATADAASDSQRKEREDARQRALNQSKDPRHNYMPEGADRKELYSDVNAERTDNAPAPVVPPKKRKPPVQVVKTNKKPATAPAAGDKKDAAPVTEDKTPKYDGSGMAGSDTGSKGLGPITKLDENSPQAKALQKQRHERQHKQFLQKRAGLSGTGITTPGDPNKKEPTSAGFRQVQKAVEGTVANRNRSTVLSDKDKMRERALEVERRRKEELAKKQGYGIKKGGMVKKYAAGGSVKASGMGSVKQAKPSMGSASKRADGIAQRGKTKGRIY